MPVFLAAQPSRAQHWCVFVRGGMPMFLIATSAVLPRAEMWEGNEFKDEMLKQIISFSKEWRMMQNRRRNLSPGISGGKIGNVIRGIKGSERRSWRVPRIKGRRRGADTRWRHVCFICIKDFGRKSWRWSKPDRPGKGDLEVLVLQSSIQEERSFRDTGPPPEWLGEGVGKIWPCPGRKMSRRNGRRFVGLKVGPRRESFLCQAVYHWRRDSFRGISLFRLPSQLQLFFPRWCPKTLQSPPFCTSVPVTRGFKGETSLV